VAILQRAGYATHRSKLKETFPIYDIDLRATHAHTILPAVLAFVSFGLVRVRVRVRVRAGYGGDSPQLRKSKMHM
jgi:hypothetical protein